MRAGREGGSPRASVRAGAFARRRQGLRPKGLFGCPVDCAAMLWYHLQRMGAVNGTLRQLPHPTRFIPEGDTDSERAFCLLLDWMEEETVSFSDFCRLEERLRELNSHGSMNLLFSDGHALFAYRDIGGYNALYFTYRQAPFPTIRLVDEDWEVDLAEEKRPSEKGFVIATQPLTDEHWYGLDPGRLLVIRDGKAVHGDSRK